MAIKLNKTDIAAIIPSLKQYFREEYEMELSDLRAGFLLEYILQEIGPFPYNQGVRDAENYFRSKVEELPAICFEQGLTYRTSKRK